MLLTGEFFGISSPLEREREEPVEASLRESERVTVRARARDETGPRYRRTQHVSSTELCDAI